MREGEVERERERERARYIFFWWRVGVGVNNTVPITVVHTGLFRSFFLNMSRL